MWKIEKFNRKEKSYVWAPIAKEARDFWLDIDKVK